MRIFLFIGKYICITPAQQLIPLPHAQLMQTPTLLVSTEKTPGPLSAVLVEPDL